MRRRSCGGRRRRRRRRRRHIGVRKTRRSGRGRKGRLNLSCEYIRDAVTNVFIITT
jgi:hypothetical protein